MVRYTAHGGLKQGGNAARGGRGAMSDNEVYRSDRGEDSRTAHDVREDGGPRSFDPTPYVRQLRGRGGAQDYIDVKFRLLWLRREHPNAEIITEHIRIDDDIAIFRATVTIPGGGKATGHGSETAKDFPDYIEKAETKALGRALNALGYGAKFAEGEDAPGAAGDFVLRGRISGPSGRRCRERASSICERSGC